MKNESEFSVGRPVSIVDGPSKARGSMDFLQDITLPNILHASMVYAGRPHARIKELSAAGALALDGVHTIATCDDVPGENRVGVVIDDQSLFAAGIVRYEADCVAIVGAEDPGTAAAAARLVEVTYEDMSPVLSIEEAARESAIRVHEKGNLAVEKTVVRGRIEAGEAQADHVVEHTFHTPAQEHAYLEPLGALAIPRSDGVMEILAPGQCPFYIRDAVARCLGLPLSRIHVIQLPLGGGFGGKEDVPSEICARLAVLATKSRRPVRLLLSREEDMVYSSKRHPMALHYRMGCDRSGRILFADIGIDADVGAYATLSPIVLFRSTVHAAGPYDIPNVRIRTRGYYTNTVPKGAMRGFGTPQVVFACEAMIDEMAALAGIDPLDMRLANALREGSRTATGQVLDEEVGLVETLELARDAMPAGAPGCEPASDASMVRARGAASMFYGVSLGAAGRKLDRGGARVEIFKDGSVSVFVGCTDMGQGALTVLAQIAASALGIPVGRVTVKRVDTNVVPDSGPTVASRTTVVSGNAILDACDTLKQRMTETAHEVLGESVTYDTDAGGAIGRNSGFRLRWDSLIEHCLDKRVDLSANGWFVVPECRLDDATGQGKAYYAYSFATDVAEVEVDMATGGVRVLSVTAVHDSGKIVNPMTAVGQVEGGIAQGLGYALSEKIVLDGGRMSSRDLSTYLVPTSLDVCDDITVKFVECLSKDGPFGAKGLGEPAIIPVGAAIANAVSKAIGARIDTLPIDASVVIRSRPESA